MENNDPNALVANAKEGESLGDLTPSDLLTIQALRHGCISHAQWSQGVLQQLLKDSHMVRLDPEDFRW